MTPRTCRTCLYSYFDFAMACASFSPNFPPRPLCSNHPDSPGQLRPAPHEPCRNYRPKPDPTLAIPEGEDVRRIPLTRGKFALVDAADFEWLSRHRWSCRGGGNPYAARFQGNKVIWMHREIMQTPPDKVCDHIDTIGLNNRRRNLRNCDRRDNVHNVSKGTRGSSSFKGVFWDKRLQKWCAKICCDNKVYRLGYFTSEIEAALAYDNKAKELFGVFAHLNFPAA
jgi:hypothetical protein